MKNNNNKLTKFVSNGRRRNRRPPIRAIANALNATPVVRNMMPKSSTFFRKIDWPLYLFLKTNRQIVITTEVTGGTEIDMPTSGLEFTACPEFTSLYYEVDTLRLVALGSTVNFVQNEQITIVNLYEKWMYGDSPKESLCSVDSTYQPLEWDNKLKQSYKTYIPAQTAGYMTYYSYNAFSDILRNINYQLFGETGTIPAQNTLIGTITLAMWVECKRKQTMNIDMMKIDKENDKLKKEVEELKLKLDKFMNILGNENS